MRTNIIRVPHFGQEVHASIGGGNSRFAVIFASHSQHGFMPIIDF
jgi:hypothetical protein